TRTTSGSGGSTPSQGTAPIAPEPTARKKNDRPKRPSDELGLFLFPEGLPMPLDDLMRQFADLVGRALARRWLRQRGLAPPQDGDPGGKPSETLGADRPPQPQGPTSEAD